MRILVTGSRKWTDWSTLNFTLSALSRCMPDTVIVHGACPTGADMMADTWAKQLQFEVEKHPAKWMKDGKLNKGAGFARNAEMVKLGADICVAFIKNNSPGASMTADLAERSGIETHRIYEKGDRKI